MSIPDKAIDVAARAMSGQIWWDQSQESDKDEVMEDAREALEAAAPHVIAQALRDHSEHLKELAEQEKWGEDRWGLIRAADATRDRADELESNGSG